MAKTALLPASAMASAARKLPLQSVQAPTWKQLPGSGALVTAGTDGSLWVLSGTAPNKAIWHYRGGRWTNIPGAAAQLALSPTGALWAVNAGGGIFSFNGNNWTTFGGGASAIAISADGSIFVLTNGGSGDRAIWHYANGAWTQVQGAGVALTASLDPNSYVTPGGTLSSNGIYVLNSHGNIYYRNAGGAYVAFQGLAAALAPAAIGGLYALAYPINYKSGSALFYYNLSTPGWTAEPGAAVGISAGGGKLDAIGASGAIFQSSITASGTSPGPGSPLSGPLYGGLVSNCGTAGNICDGYAATDVATKLQFPVQQGYDGTGQTIAIVVDSGVAASDINTYLAYNQTPARSRTITIKGVDGGGGLTGGQGEATLDTETVAGLAPGANVVIYAIPSLTSQHIVDAYNLILSDNQAQVVNSSFGGCEFGSGMASEDALLAAGAQNGVAFVASSGDQGNECYNGPGYSVGVNYPASDPNTIGVGGTETYPSKTGGDELLNPVVWNDTKCGGQCAAGGGVSGYWAIPGYQQGLAGVSSTTFRNVPDISMPAEYDSTYEAGAWGLLSGTSWSSPEFAALMAEVYEYCGTTLENPVTAPYWVDNASGYGAFLDVTSGNDQFGTTMPYYTAGPGYDDASGIGVPFGVPFAEAACPSSRPAGARRARGRVTHVAHPAATFDGDVTPRVRGLADRGRRTAGAQTRIQIVLRVAPSLPNDERTVIEALRGAGFAIAATFPNHLVVDATAPSAAVERFFATQMHDVSQGGYGTRYMPVTPIKLPASIAPNVAGVTLDDVVTAFAPQPRALSMRR
jgi:hypothetical protein